MLLSWAVPKGPSIDPNDKRLAMQTEDHPFDYGMFEGVIPEGYGAGIVMLWDYGTWEPESEDVDAALRKGDLKFRLNGFKLKGSWVLVKTRGYGGAPNSWLLIKHQRRLGRADRHHRVRAAQREDAGRGLRGDPVGQDARHLAQQRPRQGRRHRRDVQEDHRTGDVDEGAGTKNTATTKTKRKKQKPKGKASKPKAKATSKTRPRKDDLRVLRVLVGTRSSVRQASSRCESTAHTA